MSDPLTIALFAHARASQVRGKKKCCKKYKRDKPCKKCPLFK